MSFLKTAGMQSMLKDGHQIFEDPVLKNITACKELTNITRTSLGPDGLSKLIVNYIGKVFVTHDAHTVMSEMEVQHPAAKLLTLAATAMNDEVGDGTNLVLSFAGELLSCAETLIRKGIHTSDIIIGYERALKEALKLLPKLAVLAVTDIRDAKMVQAAIAPAIGTKVPAHTESLAALTTDACINALGKDPKVFNVDNVRILKVEGMSVSTSQCIHGFLIARDAEGAVKRKDNAKVVVYQCAVDTPAGDTKGLVVVENADQLKGISKSEENFMESLSQSLAEAGVDVVVSSQAFGDLALHYLERNNIMAVRITSKHELRRLASAVGAEQLSSLVLPTPEDLGRVDQVQVEEYALQKMLVFRQLSSHSRISTLLLRGPTSATIDDAERAVHDGINIFRGLTRQADLAAGGGAAELEMHRMLAELAAQTPGLEQYSLERYAASFLVVPRTLAEVSGLDGGKTVDDLVARHASGQARAGFSVCDGRVVEDTTASGVYDLLLTKEWALRLATDAVVNILRTDQIIMSKPAGGPKPGAQSRDDD